MAILKRGLRGEPVRRLQEKLGVGADGIFGKGTEDALRDYQKQQGIAVDGIAGPDTFAHVGLHELVLLKRGVRGDLVEKLQEFLGLDVDGVFGGETESAVKAFQRQNDLVSDGLAGPETLALMDVFEEFTEEVAAAAVLPEEPAQAAQAPDPDAGVKAARSVWTGVMSMFDK